MRPLFTLLLFLINTNASSQSKNVFVKLGTTGIGSGYEQKINTKWNATASLSYMNFSPSIFLKRGSYQHLLKGKANFTQLEIAGKWYPAAKATSYGATNNNKFFIKAGLLIRDNGNYLIQSDYQKTRAGHQFDHSDPASGKIIFKLKTNIIQPFLTTGFELINSENKWCLNFEAGLSYHGTSPTVPFVNFYETGAIKIYEPKFNNWVRIPQLIRMIKVYPLINFNIGRRF